MLWHGDYLAVKPAHMFVQLSGNPSSKHPLLCVPCHCAWQYNLVDDMPGSSSSSMGDKQIERRPSVRIPALSSWGLMKYTYYALGN